MSGASRWWMVLAGLSVLLLVADFVVMLIALAMFGEAVNDGLPQRHPADSEGVDRRADIVDKTRKSQFLSSDATTDSLRLLHDKHTSVVAGKLDRGSEAVGTGSDHDCVIFSPTVNCASPPSRNGDRFHSAPGYGP